MYTVRSFSYYYYYYYYCWGEYISPREFDGFGGQIQLLQSFFFSANEASNMAHRRVNNRYYQDTRVCQLLFWATLMEEVGVP